ncbi:MAG: TetR/AcrR family transcriptional regulator [Holophaga sp.]|nr:TetR/AcrR family transcriptional regulator [Holophaga sp.]
MKPRKRPLQARARATVDAIFDATIQVLLADGLQQLTTVRVAERAGASVGTLYQYYPHKEALLYSVLERHLLRIWESVERAAASVHHTPLATMVPAVVDGFLRSKFERPDEARALYQVAGDLHARDLVLEGEERCRAAFAAMLGTATDARFADLPTTAFMVTGALAGPTRAVLEGGASPRMVRALRSQLVSVCLGYLEREARAVPASRDPAGG